MSQILRKTLVPGCGTGVSLLIMQHFQKHFFIEHLRLLLLHLNFQLISQLTVKRKILGYLKVNKKHFNGMLKITTLDV